MSAVSLAIQQLRAALNIEKDRMSQNDAVACIDSISGIIRELKAHFNASSPIGRLPEALLAMIFKLAAFDETVDSLEACEFRLDVDFRTLISLSHVCTEWRGIALGYPALWTRLDVHCFQYRHVFEALVRRTKAMPLDINIPIDQHGFKYDSNCYFKEYASRVRHMKISILHADGIPGVAEMLSLLCSTSLECLKISYLDDEQNHIRHHGPLEEVLISGQEVSYLKALSLDAADVLPFVLTNRFPDLTLTCAWCVVDVLGMEHNESSAIVMANMKTLHFHDSDLPSAFKIVSHLSLPICALVRFDYATGHDDLPKDAAGPLAPLFNKPQFSVHNAMRIEFGYITYPHGYLLIDGPLGAIWLQGMSDLSEWMTSHYLNIRSATPLSTVTSLVLDTECWNRDATALFHAFPCLVDLSLKTVPRDFLIHALVSSPAACTSLRSLTIVYGAEVCERLLDRSLEAAGHLATDLMLLAKGRDAAGTPLLCITIQLCQHELLPEEFNDEVYLTIFERHRKLYTPLADIVEKFKYMEPGIHIPKFGERMEERFLPDDKYWDIMRHQDYW